MTNKTNRKAESPNFLVSLIGDEKRQQITIPLFAVAMSIVAGSLLLLALGKNPLGTYYGLLQGAGLAPKGNYAGGTGQLTDLMSLLDAMAPMIFGALAVTVALKAGLFNIGVAGQMLLSGFVATVVVGYSGLPAVVAKPTVIVIGVILGALCGGLIGFLKYKFNISEVVSSIMLNYIFQYLISFVINLNFLNPLSRQSDYISKAASLTFKNTQFMGVKADIPLGIFLAVVTAYGIYFLLSKTVLGYEIKAVGANRNASAYAGINVGKTMVMTMMISGALSGLAGVCYYLGYYQSIQPRMLASLGFDAIATSLLGNTHPIGVVFSSVLITTLEKGANFMSSKMGVVKEISGVLTGLILLFSATGAYIKYKIGRYTAELERNKKMDSEEGEQ